MEMQGKELVAYLVFDRIIFKMSILSESTHLKMSEKRIQTLSQGYQMSVNHQMWEHHQK
jgi:hypothetical protein